MNTQTEVERLRVLSRFIHNQANLTDSRHPVLGPGSVTLNHEEALLAAHALDAWIALMKDIDESPA